MNKIRINISSEWIYFSDVLNWHFTFELPDSSLNKDMMVRHCFLKFLDSLKIIEYSRGYDGLYYDITIKQCGEK